MSSPFATGILRLARIPFLMLGLLMYLAGALLALNLGAAFSPQALLIGYAILLAAQLSVHLSNDYFDLEADLHARPTPFSGGTGVLTTVPALRRPARLAAMALALLSVALGLAFALAFLADGASRAVFVLFVAGGNGLAWAYTAPPFRLVYRGLGEMAVGIGVGVMWAALGYLVVQGTVDLPFLFLALPFYFIVLLCIIITEIPDGESDRLASKMTLVARWGDRAGYAAAASAGAVAPALALLPVIVGGLVPRVNFLPLAAIALLPAVVGLGGVLRRPSGRPQLVGFMKAVMLSFFAAVILTDLYFAGTLMNWITL